MSEPGVGADGAADEVFQRLRDILRSNTPGLTVAGDSDSGYTLNAKPTAAYPDGIFFGAVRRGKRYISYHLMAVYVAPELLASLSPELRRRMQGKSCFNFTRVDQVPAEELGRLTAAGLDEYRRRGWADS